MKKGIISILALSLAIASCNKDKSDNSSNNGFTSVESIEDLKVPSSFDWASSKQMTTDIYVEGIEGIAKSQVRIDIYDVDPYEGGKILFSGFTNNQGKLEVPVKIATRYKEVVVVANTMGVGGNRITAKVSGNTIKAHFSGVPQARKFDKHSSAGTTPTLVNNIGGSDLPLTYYLGGFNSDGVPSGMGSVSISQAYLDNLALTLPEKNHLPCDPVRKALLADLFCNEVTTSKDDAEVWVTFVGEGAGFKNALAYYYYPAGSEPATRADIDSVFVIFPNASSGPTNLQAGDRVKIGTFPKNTTIEWVLLGDMWDPNTDQVNYDWDGKRTRNFFFGENDLNTDMGVNQVGCPDPNFKQHMISFTDNLNGEDIQLFAFEDINYPSGDFDFNDCVFYATGDLYPSCAPQLVVPGGSQADTDGDGIIDQYDDEPNNPDVACLITYDGTLLFEDLWPSKGDYDFNDLVTGYVVTHAIHANGYVHEVRADYTAKASGAGFNNGFGTVLSEDLMKADISSITGRTSTGNFPMDGDLTATPGTDLVMYNWDRTKDIVSNDINGGAFFNTVNGGGKGNFVTENIVIEMVPNAVDQWELGLPPYNPFIFANQDDTKEIHLADMAPSSLNDNSRFGTANDDSQPGINRYYKTTAPSNLPWALDIPAGAFEWPLERVDILTAYPDFAAWAMSGGVINPDWYNFPAPGQTYTP